MIEHDNFIDLTDQLSFHETYALLKECDAVVTMDSGLLHIANATDTVVIALFTDVDPCHRMRYKNGRVGYRTVALSSPCPMQYCASQFGYNENKCRLSGAQRMCCLPSVDDVCAALKKTILD
jgi:ADP-heptose:LPS heptosyltransferase